MFRPREGFSHDLAPLGFGLILLLLLGSGLVAFVNIARVVDHANWVAHTHEVIAALESLLATTTDAETGQLGYLMTERTEYLEPYDAATARLKAEIGALRDLIADNPGQTARLAEVEKRIGERLAIMAQSIESAKGGDFASGRSVMSADQGKQVMDRLREDVARMQNEERRLLAERSVAATGSHRLAIASVLIATILGVGLVGSVFYLIRQSTTVLEEQRERLRVTLASIGDGVLTTDTRGRVTFLNGVAEELTGWSNEEAREQPVETVFRIVNEQTGAIVPNPIERVLKEGVIVALANHTELIAKDGKRRPIDDSGAPIRSDGKVVGAVLIFRDVTERRQHEHDLRERSELLRVTLASIGDAMLATDATGRITFLNDVAIALTGWSMAEATGQPVETVFRIVNELSGETVEGPIARVLRQGIIVGLANHTVLIAKDGTRRPIDDSGAPIRDAEGKIIGGVLVFRDVAERRRAELLLTHQRLILERMVQGATLEEVLDAVCAAAEQLSGEGAIGTIMLADEEGKTLRAAAGKRCPPEYVRGLGDVPIGDGIGSCGSAAFRREAVVVEDIASDPRWTPFAPLALSHGLRASCSTPIVSREGKTLGALGLYYPVPHRASEEDLQLLDVLARTAGIAIERARTEGDRQRFISLAENSTDFIGMCDLDGLPFYVNEAGLKLVGLDSLADARQTPVRDYFHPDDRDRVMGEFFPEVLRRGYGEIEARFRHFQTGAPIWMLYTIFALTDGVGKRVGLATISRNVDERRRLEDNLRQLAADLSDADRKKNEFIATLAHELRNPLAPIRTGLEVMKLASTDSEMVEEIRATMERQAQQMVRLIDDLLDVSRITQGKMQLRKCRVVLADVVQSAVEATRPFIDEAHHELRIELPSEELALDVDPARLAQVIANLLGNAAKYTPEGGRIVLAVSREGSDAVISVKDNGLGIPAESVERIFEMFAQIDRSMERGYKGLGIGLTLVKSIVEMHGGKVSVRSEGPGKGSQFTCRLPLLATTYQQAPEHSETASAAVAEKRKILVVDDSRDAAAMLGMVLKALGNDVRLAHDGLEAIEAARDYRPEVIFMDIGMPRLNGYEAAQRIRQETWGGAIHLVALTGWGQDEDRRRTQDAGFDHHLIKPAEPATLRQLLAGLERR